MSQVPRASLLFARARQFVARNKSTFVYDVDKTFSQRWVIKQTQKQQQLQKFWSADDSVPLWWKSPTDKLLTTVAFAGTVASFIITLNSLIKFSQGKL